MWRLAVFPLEVYVTFCAESHVNPPDFLEIPFDFCEMIVTTWLVKDCTEPLRVIRCTARAHNTIHTGPVITYRYGCR
jgi:hypothetical protein